MDREANGLVLSAFVPVVISDLVQSNTVVSSQHETS